jgi:hypothetical protein
MEVHHHPDLHHRKKQWREYFLEFLMIFLAVTMGFIAENIRESIGDHSKEKEYVVSIKKDLEEDTSGINGFLPALYSRINRTDTLIKLLQTSLNTSRGNDLYYYARISTKMRSFETAATTLTELSNSGNFRLLTNQDLTKGIIKYQKIIDVYNTIIKLDEQEGQMSYPLLGDLFDASVFNTMLKTGSARFSIDTAALAIADIEKPTGNPQLRNHDADKINLLIFYLHERKGSFIGEMSMLQEQKKSATSLIQIINKEYHLENE